MPEIDLTAMLRQWPYRAGEVNARIVRAADGRKVLQVRVDLGILQMEMQGRPDGQRPQDADSWLDFFLNKNHDRKDHEPTADDPPAGDQTDLSLSSRQCRLLREEAIQYYHRYVGLFALDAYDEVVRDTIHNLALIDLCRRYAESDTERRMMASLLPHTIMMRARAQASKAVDAGDGGIALAALDAGLAEIRAFLLESAPEAEVEALLDQLREVQVLREMRNELVPKLPVSLRAELQERLEAAVHAENFELAAILRDELRQLQD